MWFGAEIEAALRFRNVQSDPIEATLTVLLAEAALSGLEVEVAGRKVVAKCMEKQKAQNKYEDAIASGKGAYMAEQGSSEDEVDFSEHMYLSLSFFFFFVFLSISENPADISECWQSPARRRSVGEPAICHGTGSRGCRAGGQVA
jgi:hypothetical protein